MTPGATEAVTPEQDSAGPRGRWSAAARRIAGPCPFISGSKEEYNWRCEQADIAIREAEANALRRAADMAEAWVSRATQFPREFRYHAECNRAHEEQISGLGAAIRSLLPKEEGKRVTAGAPHQE